VIATDCPSRPLKHGERGNVAGGVRELVRDGVDGMLVPCEDPVALANAMADLIEHPDKRQRLAQQAAPGMARFSRAKIVDDWERLFEQARGPTGGRSVFGRIDSPRHRREDLTGDLHALRLSVPR
jgi:Glycosyl transferases group 1